MELRQLRYFVRIVELGSMGRAAYDLGVGQSALSQQVSRLESEISTRLFVRDARGVSPTEAGNAFFREAQLILRHANRAVRAAQQSRFTGTVSIGLASTTASILGLDLITAMHARYPDVRLNLVESSSNNLAVMLNARELDFAILFDARLQLGEPQSKQRHLEAQELVEEKLFWVSSKKEKHGCALHGSNTSLALSELQHEPLILPTPANRLRTILDNAFTNVGVFPNIAFEVDSLMVLMSAVESGQASTILPWAALLPYGDSNQRFVYREISDIQARRKSLLFSQMQDELSPAALATRVVLMDCVKRLVAMGGSYDFGAAKITAFVSKEANTNVADVNGYLVGVKVPAGPGYVRASVSATDNGTAKSTQVAAGYVYTLDKQTDIYVTVASVNNSGGATAALNASAVNPNSASSGFDIGIKYAF